MTNRWPDRNRPPAPRHRTAGMADRHASYIRTYYPLLLGHLTAVLAAWLLKTTGVAIPGPIVYELLSLVLSGAVYALGRHLEARPARWAQLAGRWLLSAGLPVGPPTYVQQGTPPALPPPDLPPPPTTPDSEGA